MTKTVIWIVRDWLTANGYDGLCSNNRECACCTDDLAPCGNIGDDCEAGHKRPCNCGDHDWHIVPLEEPPA